MQYLYSYYLYYHTCFWFIGRLTMFSLLLRWDDLIDTYIWLTIHVSYSAKLISYTRPPFRIWLEVKLTAALGLISMLAVLLGLAYLINYTLHMIINS